MFHKIHNIKVPVELQNRSLTVSGVIRLIQETLMNVYKTYNMDDIDMHLGLMWDITSVTSSSTPVSTSPTWRIASGQP